MESTVPRRHEARMYARVVMAALFHPDECAHPAACGHATVGKKSLRLAIGAEAAAVHLAYPGPRKAQPRERIQVRHEFSNTVRLECRARLRARGKECFANLGPDLEGRR